jgi:hypothetical protein
MKKNDSGDFCVLYLEPGDNKDTLFQVIASQKKPIVLMLAEQSRVFQRPDDFNALKRVKRQLDLPVVFVIPHSGHFTQMAARSGFPVYLSIDALADALTVGQMTRQRKTTPLVSDEGEHKHISPKKTIPLTSGSGEHTSLPRMGNRPSGEHASLPRMGNRPSGEYPSLQKIGNRPSGKLAPSTQGRDFISPEPYHNTGAKAAPLRSLARPSAEHALPGHINPAPVQMRVAPLASDEGAPFPRMNGQSVLMEDIALTRTAPLVDESVPRRSRPLVSRPLTPQPTPLPPTKPLPPPSLMAPPPRSKPQRRFPLLLVLLTFALVIAGLGSFMMLTHALPADTPLASAIIGHISFSSSDQVSENSSQGIEDQLTIDLTNIAAPAAHKSYYAWLLGDKGQSDPKAILIGKLTMNNGTAHLFYTGDSQHTNLLLVASRFLVTEEDSTMTPISPSPDQTAWRFYGEFSNTPINSPDNTNHFSFLDHLRHLLASDPTLNELELPGGLNKWLYINTGKVLEWTSSTRQQWEDSKDVGFVRRQTTRVLTYLDGISFIGLDLPADAPTLVNDRLARVGLLEVNGQTQDPPGYLQHIVHHLNGLLQAGGNTPQLRQEEADLITAMNNTDHWLTQVRRDAQQIMKMSDQQLQQPATLNLLNDMIDNANHAYTGQLDPATGQMREGVIWIHDHMQNLATLNINTITPNNNNPVQMVPDTKHPKALIQNIPGTIHGVQQ